MPLLVVAAALATYLPTMTPEVDFIDSGELAAAACSLGITHPTGYPLFTLIAHFWAKLPIAGRAIVRLNLMSLFFAASAAGVFTILTKEILTIIAAPPEARGGGGKKKRAPGRKISAVMSMVPPPVRETVEALQWLAAGTAGLILVWTATFWMTATTLEVYSLHGLFTASLLLLAFRYHAERDPQAAFRRGLLSFFILGLSFANHLTTGLLIPPCLILFWSAWRRERPPLRRIVLMALPALVGPLFYLYLPWRTAAQSTIIWGMPDTPKAIWDFLTVSDFRIRLFANQVDGEQWWKFLLRLPGRTGYVAIPLILWGIAGAWRRCRLHCLALLIACLLPAIYASTYNVPDNIFYFNPGLIAFLAFAGVGAFLLASALGRRGRPLIAGAILLPLASLPALFANLPTADRSGNYFVRDYVTNLFSAIKPNAILFALDNHTILHPLYYYQNVEGFRPDVIVLSNHGLQKGWFGRQLSYLHPEIYRGSQKEIEEYRSYLEKIETGQARDYRLLDEKYYGMLGSIVAANFENHPIYITSEFDPEQHRAFHPGLKRIPEGLAWRLYRTSDTPEEFPYREFAYRDLPYPHSDADAARHAYLYMFRERALYESSRGRIDLALKWLDRAAKIFPGEKLLSDSHNGRWVVPNRYREVLATRAKLLQAMKAAEGKTK